MRIIAGELGRRQFAAPDSHATHPMSERVRGGLFNSLGDRIQGARILDAFSGSGAMSFEAISRGADHALAIERDRRAQQIIERNIDDLGVKDRVKLIKASCSAWSDQNPEQKFDLILCDPPYNNLQLSTVTKLIRHLKDNGLMVLSYPGRESAPTVNGVVVVDNLSYGDAALAYYRKTVA